MAAFVLSQIMNLVCTIVPCEGAVYEPPVSLLPRNFQSRISIRQAKATLSNADFYNEILSSSLSAFLPIVETKSGIVEGYFMKVVSGRDIYAFEGIPYAENPSGANRFRPPIPKRPWKGIRSAKAAGAPCMQLKFPLPQVIGKEDCLTINAYTPELPIDSYNPKLPVMIFIHGGAYTHGNGADSGPAYLLEQDIVLINFNYRLGVLGLLSTGDASSPGNYQFKDQALAIEWTVKNIHLFGGDPTRITLAGQSSGANSVHLHMMSALPSRNLFHRVMLYSGSAFNFWSLESSQEALNRTKKFAALSFCPSDAGMRTMMNCLRSSQADYLVANQLSMLPPGIVRLPPFPFLPTIEPDIPGAFITESPEDLYLKGNVKSIPMLYTTTSKELDLLVVVLERARAQKFFKSNYFEMAPSLLGYRNKVKNDTETSKKILEFYGKGKDIMNVERSFAGEVATDRYFTLGMRKTLQLHSALAPTYAAQFAFQSDLSYASMLGQDPYAFGVSHNEDQWYLFNSSSTKPIARSDPKFAITKLLVNLYTNFVSHGKPVFTSDDDYKDHDIWQPIKDSEHLQFLKIDRETLMISDPLADRSSFWESLGIRDSLSKPYKSSEKNY